MEHKLHEVTNFKFVRPYTLEIQFDDGVRQEVNGLIPEKWTVEKCSSAQVKGAEGNEEKSVQ